MRWMIAVGIVLTLGTASVTAATLEVGAGKAFTRIEDALAQAAAGDQIVIYPGKGGAAYPRPALLVKTPRLTIRGADAQGWVALDGRGFNYSGNGRIPRAMIEFARGADDCTVEGLELTGARNESYNGAGVRINQANGITIRRCKIHGNDMGIMSNGSVAAHTGAGQLIEGCLITDNGSEKEPGQNHNLYLGGTSVTVRGCEIARAVTGHNLKSRAHFNWIEYNYLHDSANRELDLVDAQGNTDLPGSDCVLLGNILVKKPDGEGNHAVIHFGQDGGHDHAGTIFLVHNTIVTPYSTAVLQLSAPGCVAVFVNNLVSDRGTHQAGLLVLVRNGAALEKVTGAGNVWPERFTAQIPAQVQAGTLVAWDRIGLPWPQGRREALEEYQGVGVIQPRTSVTAGAGAFGPQP
jgi:hypothetical protein